MKTGKIKKIYFSRISNESASRIAFLLLTIVCFGVNWQASAQAAEFFRNELPFEIADSKFFGRRIFNSNKNFPPINFNVESPSQSFVVNSTGDGADADTANSICETAIAGECTLRAAIQQANAAAVRKSMKWLFSRAESFSKSEKSERRK